MNNIKVRGKHILDGTWVYGTGVTDFLNIYYKKDNRIFIWALDYRWVEIDPKTLSQFTGLLDKNSVDIYEGDIVKHYDKFIGEVRWLQPDCAFVLAGSSHRYTLLIDERLRNEYEVIGNIYENSELLK